MNTKRSFVILAFGLGALTAIPCASAAEPPGSFPSESPQPLAFSLTPAARFQFPADVGESEVDVLRASTELSILAPLHERLNAGLSLKYEFSRYSWNNFERVIPGVGAPIRDGSMLTFSPTLSYDIDDRWSVTGGGLLMFAAGDGAVWDDAATYGGFALARYQFSKAFSLSCGLVASSRLEEDALVLPLINFEWQIDERWRLETTGLGVRGSYKVSEQLTLIADGGYEFREYRLKDSLGGGLGGGVFRDNAAIAGVGLQWRPGERWTIEGTAGMVLGGEARFDDANGNRVREVDTDAAPFIGISVRFEF